MDSTNSQLNSTFWNELCGSHLATQLGITDSSPLSLKRFDDWYFDFYPYLKPFLRSAINTTGKVLEIGLGYGTVAGYLISEGVKYTGIDIAAGPVSMANLRASQLGIKSPLADLGDALNLNHLLENSFDVVVSIGSLHHTGDFRQAISEVVRVTRPGGLILGMVYSGFSLRNWKKYPFLMIRRAIYNLKPGGSVINADEQLRWLSDHNSSGSAAPSTEYLSRRALRAILGEYGTVSIRTRNLDSYTMFGLDGLRVRQALLRTPLPRIAGLDLYFTLRKKS